MKLKEYLRTLRKKYQAIDRIISRPYYGIDVHGDTRKCHGVKETGRNKCKKK